MTSYLCVLTSTCREGSRLCKRQTRSMPGLPKRRGGRVTRRTTVKPSATLRRRSGSRVHRLLDIMFRLEREFRIKIHQDELFPEPFLVGDSAFIDDGRLTDDGLAAALRPLHAVCRLEETGARSAARPDRRPVHRRAGDELRQVEALRQRADRYQSSHLPGSPSPQRRTPGLSGRSDWELIMTAQPTTCCSLSSEWRSARLEPIPRVPPHSGRRTKVEVCRSPHQLCRSGRPGHHPCTVARLGRRPGGAAVAAFGRAPPCRPAYPVRVLISRTGGVPIPQNELSQVPRPVSSEADSIPEKIASTPGDLDEIEQLQSENAGGEEPDRREMNLRLVVSIAKKRVFAGYDLGERVGDGNLAAHPGRRWV